MEHKLTNTHTVFDFLSTIVLRDHSNWRANKNEDGKRNNAHPHVRSKRNK